MTQKLVMLLSTEAGSSPAELLFGSTPLLSCPEFPFDENSSSHQLSLAEIALRTEQLADCNRLMSRALRCLSNESRALTSQEWLLLAGVSLLNGNLESCEHQLQMAIRGLQHVSNRPTRELLRQRIVVIRSVLAGIDSPEAGLEELLTVFRFLGTTRCHELCEQALRVREILLKWKGDDGACETSAQRPASDATWHIQRGADVGNPEWN